MFNYIKSIVVLPVNFLCRIVYIDFLATGISKKVIHFIIIYFLLCKACII